MARRPRTNKVEHRMARALDELAEFEKFQEDILPILQTALKEGWSAEKIFNHPKAQALLAARALTIGIMDRDSGRALAAVKDIMDRTVGKATEKLEVTNRLEKMPDEQLDALIRSQLGADEDSETETH